MTRREKKKYKNSILLFQNNGTVKKLLFNLSHVGKDLGG